MISLAAQITAASRYAQREAAQRAAEARLKAERQAETRAKQWASRKAGGNGINDELLKRLPTAKEKAITLAQIKHLLRDLEARDGSISGALSILVKAKRVQRTGQRRDYRYYLAEGKKP